MASRKRKRTGDRRVHDIRSSNYSEASSSHSVPRENDIVQPEPDPSLFIQAHEADIIHGPEAKAAADSLEVFEYVEDADDPWKPPRKKIGDALIRWEGVDSGKPLPSFPGDDDGDEELPAVESEDDGIWVDRYDIRLLLDTLPLPSAQNSYTNPNRASPTGWSDLPSDTEDTFFFTPDEVEDIRKEKRRKVIERAREERLRARIAEDGEEEETKGEEEEIWGGSDEEPEELQKDLMKRTATHLLTSPNPAQLEMRILANHGADKRFAFLRGRWKRAWQIVKGKARMEKERQEKKESGLGILAGYGDSDEEESEGGAGVDDGGDKGINIEEQGGRAEAGSSVQAKDIREQEDVAKEARRLRAKEWAEKRRTEKRAES